MRRPLLGTLFAIACVSIVLPAIAAGIPIHKHIRTEKPDGHVIVQTLVYDVAPKDSDKDGIANRKDDCPQVPDPNGCPPKSAPVAAPVSTSVAPTPTTSSVGGCPASMAAESGSAGYGAVNGSSGAYGCYQILPSTSAAYGCDMSSPAGQDACAQAICADVGSSAWAASGASPC